MTKLIFVFKLSILLTIKSFGQLAVPTIQVEGDSSELYEKAFRIAVGDVFSNLGLVKKGMLSEKQPCLLAGLSYDQMWTRDFSINAWNGTPLFIPDYIKNSLLAVLEGDGEEVIISGQYWDKIIWALGAWRYYILTGDKDFLPLAYEAISTTMLALQENEYSSDIGLFRGPAVYGDGIAAYPDKYTKTGTYDPKTEEWLTTITQWATANPDEKHPKGGGMPMHTLSTNALYVKSYEILASMHQLLGKGGVNHWESKAIELKAAINTHFWNPQARRYGYLIEQGELLQMQEGLGLSFGVLFDVFPAERISDVFANVDVVPTGMPCLYPSFKRYQLDTGNHVGRHSGTVWPFIQGFWGLAAAQHNKHSMFQNELHSLAYHAVLHDQFVEILHPTTGSRYGGLHENQFGEGPIYVWESTPRQTWSATAYLSNVLYGLVGLDFNRDELSANPTKIPGVDKVIVEGLMYRGKPLSISVDYTAPQSQLYVNGNSVNKIEVETLDEIAIEIKSK